MSRRSAESPVRLVHDHARIREGVAFARCAGREQELPHRGGEPERDGRDIRLHEPHGVVDRETGGHRAAGGIDVEVNVAVRVLRVEQQHLRADRVGVLVLDFGAQEDDALLEQPLVDVVVEPGRAAAAVGLDGRRGVVVCHVFDTSGHPRQSHGSLPAVRPQRSATSTAGKLRRQRKLPGPLIEEPGSCCVGVQQWTCEVWCQPS